MKTQVTIKDIAKALNISISTVSRALQDHPDISKKTKELVNQYAKEHHYRPNAIALSLKTKRTNIIGVIVPEIVHHFFSSVFAGIEDTANQNGLSVIMCQTTEDYEKEVVYDGKGDDSAAILFSGGTTGTSKGTAHRHARPIPDASMVKILLIPASLYRR